MTQQQLKRGPEPREQEVSSRSSRSDYSWLVNIIKAIASLLGRSRKTRRVIKYREKETTLQSSREREFTYWEEHSESE